MKKVFFILLLAIGSVSYAQVHDPIKWSTSVNKISDNEAELVITALIEHDWHLYSQNIPQGGPIPTLFTFNGDSRYLKKGNTSEPNGHEIDDPIFEMKIKYFDTKAVFKQKIRLKTTEKFKVKGMVEFMVCTGENCLPPKEVELTFDIN
ncbi:protein-disulfide reductase DsbD domain-containing protein [Tenacibaculum crassostreae]|uniref:protein-disulfide reductase DsbD domain-containing protein n=1 Tax=Tenacibaculum crassostreae TaxID=502683 RepID=UPI0038939622